MDTGRQSCIHKQATVLDYKKNVAVVRVHTDNEGCRGCGEGKRNSCILYTFGSIFSRHRDIRQVASKQQLKAGERIQLVVRSSSLLKIAVACYGIPSVMLTGSATLAHLLLGIEWLTVLIGLGSLSVSYLLAKLWLHAINIPNIRLIR